MVIQTHMPEIEYYRKGILQMLVKDYPLTNVIKYPDKEFHRWLQHYDLLKEIHFVPDSTIDNSHPYIQVDMSRCINCFRCVRICNTVQGQFVWHIIGRGEETKIISDSKGPFAESSCVSCGACADSCPTGAIEDKQVITFGAPQKTVRSVCAYCGVGCEINVGVKNENSYDDIEKAATILVAGANTTESHPVIGARIKQAVLKGANLIVIDPRKTELAKYATYHLQIKPGTNIPLLNAMANIIVTENLHDQVFVDNRTEGWEQIKNIISEWTPERAAKICRIHPRLICEAARLFARRSPSMCFHGLGLTEHTQGTENVIALVNLALLTGNMGKPGTGINPLRGQNNVQGAAVMGCDPSVFTGMASVRKELQRFETVWKTGLPTGKGLNMPEMLEASSAGRLKAMWITGYDVFFTMPDANHTAKAFDKLDFVIVQDMFMNETAEKFADVFLPCASSFEKEGTFMNAERRIQKVRQVIPLSPNVKPDWEIVCHIAAAMGRKELFSFTSAQDIWNEIRKVWGAVYGITYDRLQGQLCANA